MSSSRTTRTASYSIEEDQLLCRVYCDITQDPEVGKNQAQQAFWTRIEIEYHQMLPANNGNIRSWRSIQTRMQNILTVVSKLRGCVRQIENMNPSGASEKDILDRAKDLMSQDAKYPKGFRFDHVWPILKDLEKFSSTPSRDASFGSRKRNTDFQGSQSLHDIADKSIGSSSFCVDLNDDFESADQVNENNNASERPTGRNKEKKKKQLNEENKEFLKSIQTENEQIKKMFQHHQDILEKNYEVQLLKAQTEAKKVELAERQEANRERREEKRERREENKILRINLNSITDPMVRESIRNEQLQIVAKRANEQTHGGGGESSSQFNQYFDNLGGNGDGLGDY
ncbi:PREDICTED: uncharacterized protein LOC109179976 [Ipomoea nil]|uniref:uncharacterized protein LOC109179976 n=1 Tax=Ipomoea nil TaxID=35883 RepID=UPI000901F3A1|nr:PREDICTED: uncharacterized protein LOC109179976 [Ipomoea nil]